MLKQVAGVAPTPTIHLVQRASDHPVEVPGLVGIQAARHSERRQAGPPQNLVDQEVPETGQTPLVQKSGLQRPPPTGQRHPQLNNAERPRIGTEQTEVGFQLGTPKSSGIIDPQSPSPAEPQPEPLPCGIRPPPSPLQILNGRPTIDQQSSGHPEPQAQRRTTGIQQQDLSVPPGRGDPPPGQCISHPGRRDPALEEPVIWRLDRGDGPSDHLFSQVSVRLDFENLRHDSSRQARLLGVSGACRVESTVEVVHQVVGVLQPT